MNRGEDRPAGALVGGPESVPRGGRRRKHRAVTAAVAVVPGGLLTGWSIAAAMYGAAVGFLFGWLFAVGTAMVFAFACYALVRMARPHKRTGAAWSCVVTTHLVYLVAIGVLMNNLR